MKLMKRIRTHIILLLVFSTAIAGLGQNNISLRTNIDTTLIGLDIPVNISIKGQGKVDSFQVQVLNINEAAKIYLPKIDTINNSIHKDLSPDVKQKTDYEISDYGNWKGNRNTLKPGSSKSNTIKLKIWDTGQFIVLPVIITDNDTIYPHNLRFYPEISVYAGLNPKDTLKAIAPIKDIIKEEKSWKDYLWIYIIALALVFIVLALIFLPKLFVNKKSRVQLKKTIKKVLPAHVIALKKLQKLKEEEIWKQGRFKAFQSQLTYILREYLENRYKIRALEQTTGEIVNSLYKINMDKHDIETIKNILQIADMVKFAKAKPESDIHEKFLNDTINFVLKTKQEEIKSDDR